MTAGRLRLLFNVWPPFLCAGIRVERLDADWRYARVRLRRRWYNRNYVGAAFGGSLFAMADPFFMILAMHRLGEQYIVWDAAGAIDFVAPGRGDVVAEFRLDDADIDALRADAAGGDKVLRWFETELTMADGTLVARVRKQLYVRLKPRHRPESGGTA